MTDSFKPTQKMAAAARRGLRLREKFGRGGTEVGLARAHQLAEQRDLDATDVKAMHSFFARHAVDKDTKTTNGIRTAIRRAGSSPGCSGAATPARAGPTARRRRSVERSVRRLCAWPARRAAACARDPRGRGGKMGRPSRREPVMADQPDPRDRHKTLQVAQARLQTALKRMTPKAGKTVSRELEAALDELGL